MPLRHPRAYSKPPDCETSRGVLACKENVPLCSCGITLDQCWLQREVGDDGLDQAGEVGVVETHGLGVGADREDNALLPGQALLDIDGEVVEIAERRHRANLAVGKDVDQ